MTNQFEERYEDVLQNIEFAIVAIYQEHPDLADSNVDRVLEGLIRTYAAQMAQRAGPTLTLSALDRTLLERVHNMCEWRLGHADEPQTQAGTMSFTPEPITPEALVACLKRIRKSVRRWTGQAGRQGYLRFVSQFIV
jgi:hypothetical protein